MRKTHLILILLSSIIVISCNKIKNKNNDRKITDTLISDNQNINKDENKIYNLILAIPEVRERATYIEKETNGKRHIKLMIVETPKENKSNYYWVKVGEDNETNFVTHFNFYVYDNSLEIKYFDTVNDTIISLEAWRKRK